jgi:CRP/FNR family cyclic AMP-dependent transcriptional regulator
MHSDPLVGVPLFAALTVEQRAELALSLTTRHVPARDTLFWIGDLGAEMFIVKDGRIGLTYPDDDGREVSLAQLGPDQFFGELSLLDGGRRTATARALVDTHLLCLDRASFQSYLLAHPTAALHVVEVLTTRQRNMLDQLKGIKNVNEVFGETTTTWMRIADAIATVSASKGFVLTHLCGVGFWITYNLARGQTGFDPFPFMLLAMVCSLEAIFLSIFVLISQNRQSEKDRVQADLDYQVNVKAHREVMDLHAKIDRLTKLVEAKSESRSDEDEMATTTAG